MLHCDNSRFKDMAVHVMLQHLHCAAAQNLVSYRRFYFRSRIVHRSILCAAKEVLSNRILWRIAHGVCRGGRPHPLEGLVE